MQRRSTAQPPNEGSSEETTCRKYRLGKYEGALDNLIKSVDDDEEVQGNAQDINSLMELLVAGEQVEMVGSETHADEGTAGAVGGGGPGRSTFGAARAILHHPT